MPSFVDYYYDRIVKHFKQSGVWSKITQQFPPGAIKVAVKKVLERLLSQNVDPETLDWESTFELLQDHRTVNEFITELETKQLIPKDTEREMLDSTLYQLEKMASDLGMRIVSEQEFDKLLDLEQKVKSSKTELQKTKEKLRRLTETRERKLELFVPISKPTPRVAIPVPPTPKKTEYYDLSGVPTQELKEALFRGHGHPPEAGYPYTRSDVLHELSKRGKQALIDLGWPTTLTYPYRNTYARDTVEPLEQVLGAEGIWDRLRDEMCKWEDQLNELTNDKFPGRSYNMSRGLETYSSTEVKKVIKAILNIEKRNEVLATFKETVRLHKGFYEYYHSDILAGEKPTPLTDPYNKGSTSIQNIISLCRLAGIDVNRVEPIETLPIHEEDRWRQVWSVIEHWEPSRERFIPQVKQPQKEERAWPISVPSPDLVEEAEAALKDLNSLGEEALKELEEL